MTTLTWTLADQNTAGPVLAGLLTLAMVVALVAICFPAVRRTNALFAPVLVLVTLLFTGLFLGTVLFLVDRLNLVN